MSLPEPSFNGNNSSSPLQRILIAAGTLVVIALTVIIAVLLAVQPTPPGTTVTPVLTPTTAAVVPSLTFTPVPPSATPTTSTGAAASPTPPPPTPVPSTSVPTNTPVPLPPTATLTPLPPTSTSTPMVVVVTPTPLPVTPTTSLAGGCQPPASWTAYTVQSGDTLNTLATRTGVSVFDLQQSNCLQNFALQVGQTIYLPFYPPSPTPTSTTTPVTPSPTPSSTPTQTATPRPPEIFEITISLARDKITIRGRYFEPNPSQGFRVELTGLSGTLPPLELGDLRSSTGFEVLIPSTVPAGDYDLRIINPDNQFVQRRITLPALPQN